MRTYINTLLIVLFSVVSFQINAQETALNDAKSAYSSGNLDDARFALEGALTEIDQAIGKEILKILPTNLSGMNFHEDQDNVIGTNMGYAGLFVDRNYGEGDKTASIDIVGDSPLMAGLSAILALPAIMTKGDENQKRIKIDGYKSLLERQTNSEGKVTYVVQIPANSTLISLNVEGYSESEVIAMANTLQVSEIVKLAQ